VSAVRFLGDVHVRRSLAEALWHREPTIEFAYVGETGYPPANATDPELLRFAEANRFAVITQDHRTMSDHVREHMAAGGHTWGLFLSKRSASWGGLVDDLLRIWAASSAEDWRDTITRLPW
jgi:hypothetical protein